MPRRQSGGTSRLQRREDPCPISEGVCPLRSVGGLLTEQVWDADPIDRGSAHPRGHRALPCPSSGRTRISASVARERGRRSNG